MKYIKMLGLLSVAAAALMAFAGVASATTLTSPTGTTYATGSTIKATAGATNLTGSFVKVECTGSTVEGKVESQGAGVTAGGKISTLDFTGCNYAVTVLKPGSLEIHGINGTYNGTLTSTGAEIDIHTSVGSCIFTTNNTHIGTLTGGTLAKLHIASAAIPRTGTTNGGSGFLCGSSGTWNGSYTVTTPHTLYIDP